MKKIVIWLIILGNIFLISLFKGCTCNPTYHGTAYRAPAWSSGGTIIYYFRNDLTVKHHKGILTGGYFEWKKNEWHICSCDINGKNREEISNDIRKHNVENEFNVYSKTATIAVPWFRNS